MSILTMRKFERKSFYHKTSVSGLTYFSHGRLASGQAPVRALFVEGQGQHGQDAVIPREQVAGDPDDDVRLPHVEL
jgi:hypothetical protein